MMLVAFCRWWKLLQHLSTKDNERNHCQDLLTIENTHSDLKVEMSHLYASDFPFKNFCNLAKQAETIRNIKNRFWLWLSIVWETHKLTRYQSGEFSCYIFKSELRQKRTRKLTTNASRSYYYSVLFSTLINSLFPLAQSINISALVRSPCLIPRHRCEKSARESRNSHHLITQCDNIHARNHDMCVDLRR